MLSTCCCTACCCTACCLAAITTHPSSATRQGRRPTLSMLDTHISVVEIWNSVQMPVPMLSKLAFSCTQLRAAALSGGLLYASLAASSSSTEQACSASSSAHLSLTAGCCTPSSPPHIPNRGKHGVSTACADAVMPMPMSAAVGSKGSARGTWHRHAAYDHHPTKLLRCAAVWPAFYALHGLRACSTTLPVFSPSSRHTQPDMRIAGRSAALQRAGRHLARTPGRQQPGCTRC
jgi:hypothetical protein